MQIVAWCGVALVVRLLALRFQPFVTFDGTEYIGLAEVFRAGRVMPSLFPPGYPALIALAQSVLVDRVAASAMVSIVCGTLLLIPVGVLAQRAVGKEWSWLALCLTALHPVLAHFSAVTMSESAFLFATFAALALIGGRHKFLGGACLGGAFAIRPEALVIAGTLALSALWHVLRRRLGARQVAAASLGFLLLAAPCWIYFRATLGVWTITPKLSALRAPTLDWHSAEPRLESGRRESPAERFGILERLQSEGLAALGRYPSNVGTVARELLVVWPLPLLVLSGWGGVRRRSMEAATLPYVVLLPLLGLSLQPRFVLIATPTLALLASIPLRETQGRRLHAISWGLLVVGYAICVATYLPEVTSPFDGDMGTAKRAGEWIAHSSEPAGPVMGRKPFVAFYAHRSNEMLTNDPYDSIVVAAQRRRVRFLVVEERLVDSMRPQLAPLVYDAQFLRREQRVELAYVGQGKPGYGIALFRVLQPGEPKSSVEPHVDPVEK